MIRQVTVLRPSQHQIGHSGDILPSDLLLKTKTNTTKTNMHL